MRSRLPWFCNLLVVPLLFGCAPPQLEQYKENTLIFCSAAQPSSFDPQTATSGATFDATSRLVYDRLLMLSPTDGSIQPGLAVKWEVKDSGLKYRFHLRPNVHFHHTHYFKPSRTLNSDDVIFSLQRQLPQYRTASANQYYYFESLGLDKLISKVEKIDDLTLDVTLTRPDSTFLLMMAMDFASIHSKEYFSNLRANNRQEQFDQLPIGTGPFRFSSYKRDVIIRYERHPNYWREPAKVEKLIITINHDAALRFAKLVAGECDVIRDPLPAQIQAAKSMRHLQLTGRSSKALSYVVLNTRKESLKSLHIRNAIAQAIDRQKIIERVYNGEADIAATLYPFATSDNLSSDAELPSQQLEGIAGSRSKEPVEIWTTYTPRPYNPSPLKMAELIQQDLIKLGLQTKIRSMEFNEFLRQLKKGNHSIALLGWIADIPHPDNFYTPLVSCSGIEGGNNFSFWCDEQLDQILSRAKNEKLWQQKLYLQVDAMIKTSSALIPIAFPKQNIIYNKRIRHLELDHSGNILFYSATIAKRSGVKQ